jgi:hypothetical protein
METRTTFGPAPALTCCSGVSCLCVVDAVCGGYTGYKGYKGYKVYKVYKVEWYSGAVVQWYSG